MAAVRLEAVFLADRRAAHGPVPLEAVQLLPPLAIASAEDLARLIRDYRITQPYTALRDAILTHPAIAEGLTVLFASEPGTPPEAHLKRGLT
jgi:hypothetical protein